MGLDQASASVFWLSVYFVIDFFQNSEHFFLHRVYPLSFQQNPNVMNLSRTLFGTLTGLSLLAATAVQGQNARIQVIHNSADAAAAQVDVYLNGALLLDNFAFRTATPFTTVPSGVDLEVAIAPSNSTNVSDAIATFTYNLAPNETYVLVANGIVSGTGYNPDSPFDIYVTGGGRESAQGPGTDVLVFHGSTDAPTVQVAETAVLGGAVIVDPFSYGEFAGYLEVPTADFVLEVQLPDGTPVVAYQAPLAALNLEGAALTVLASGFLNPANNSNGPAFGLWVALPSGGPLVELPLAGGATGEARIQVIHNSADAAAAQVDVYLNGDLLLDNFAFRTATPFTTVPSGVDLEVAIAPANSTSVAQAIATFTYNLEADETYVLVANGIVSGSGYNPAPGFDIYVSGGRESAQGPGTDVLVFHGSTDAPTVQVAETAVLGGAVIVDPFSYGEFAGYLEVPTADFVLEVQLPNGTPVAAYQAPLATLNLNGAALTVLASGFLNPANNSNGAAFGLWVALPSGGALVELPLAGGATGEARIQVIHNSADAAAAQVDVYLNGTLLLDNFAFRTATPFTTVPSGVDLEVAIAPANSTSVAQAIATFTYNLAADETYILVANGIVSASGYNPATPFDIYVTDGAREAAQGPGTDVLVFHGSTDAPTVQVAETAVLAGAVIVPPFSYGEFAGYLEVPTADFVLQVQLPDGTPVISYQAPLDALSLDGAAITVLASGFLNPGANSNGAGFGLWVALPAGGALVELPVATGVNDRDALLNTMTVWPNPSSDRFVIDLDSKLNTQATVRLTDIVGHEVRNFAVNLPAGQSRVELDVDGLANGTYTLSIMGKESIRSTSVMIVR
jgi:hypothetical protein